MSVTIHNPERMKGKIIEIQTDFRDQGLGRTISTDRLWITKGCIHESLWLASFYAPRMPLYPLFLLYGENMKSSSVYTQYYYAITYRERRERVELWERVLLWDWTCFPPDSWVSCHVSCSTVMAWRLLDWVTTSWPAFPQLLPHSSTSTPSISARMVSTRSHVVEGPDMLFISLCKNLSILPPNLWGLRPNYSFIYILTYVSQFLFHCLCWLMLQGLSGLIQSFIYSTLSFSHI